VAASHTTPTWTTVTGQEARCGSCHGLGPTGHLSSRCEGCHGAAYADGGVDPVRHADGRIDFGPGTDCNVCHAGPGTLPFRDTHGDQDPAHLTVGAHTAHLAAGHLRGPMGCPDCHLQPATVFAPGHLTPLPASVFPPGWSGLAALSGTGPAFDRTAATCSNVYCHGNSQYLLAHDATAGLTRTPSWIGGTSAQTRCGACHGLPPADGTDYHLAGTGVGDCVRCHALTVLGDGGIRFFPTASGGVRSFHIDGLVNGNN
jgi:predicted CxxxxCH...CXXCH cytochrome family protein